MSKEIDYKQQLHEFWYGEYMQSINPKDKLDAIEKLKEKYRQERQLKVKK